jgi:hypothetical protein
MAGLVIPSRQLAKKNEATNQSSTMIVSEKRLTIAGGDRGGESTDVVAKDFTMTFGSTFSKTFATFSTS